MKSTRFIKARDNTKTMRGMSQKNEKHLSTNAQSALTLNGNGNTGNSNTGALWKTIKSTETKCYERFVYHMVQYNTETNCEVRESDATTISNSSTFMTWE